MAVKNPQEPFTRISVQEAKEMLDKGEAKVVDVREPREYAQGHVADAPNIPHQSIVARKDELPDGPILFICKSGMRSALACEFAASVGRTDLYNVEGGTDAWRRAG